MSGEILGHVTLIYHKRWGFVYFLFSSKFEQYCRLLSLSLLITANWLSLSDLFHDKMRLAVGPCWRFGSPSLSEFKLNPPDWLDPQPSIRELNVEMWKAPPKKAHKLMKMVFQCLRLDSNYCMYLEIDDNLCDSSQLLSGWDNSRLNQIVKIVCGVGSAHNKATYLGCAATTKGEGGWATEFGFPRAWKPLSRVQCLQKRGCECIYYFQNCPFESEKHVSILNPIITSTSPS